MPSPTVENQAVKINNLINNNHMKRYIVFAILLFSLNSFAQQLDAGWDFTVKPGTEKWNNLVTEQERIDAVQVPEDVLNNMTAEELAVTCMQFPSFGYYSAFNTPIEGMNVMFSRFNIFQYIPKKENIGKTLINLYEDADMEGWKKYAKLLDNDFWTLKMRYIEYLIAQKFVLTHLNDLELKELISIASKKIEMKMASDSFNSLSGLSSSYYLIANILDMKGILRKSDATRNFLNTGFITDTQIIDDINDSFNQFNNLIN